MVHEKTNIEIRINIFGILYACMCMCVNFQAKQKAFDFFSPNLPRKGLRVGSSKNYCQNKNQHPRYTVCANFLSKWTTLNFSAQICRKKNLGLVSEKSNVGIRINIVETTFSFSVQICPKMDLGFEIQKTNVGTRISHLEITCVSIFRQNEQLWIFWPKFALKWI